MSRSPLAYPLNRSADMDVGGAADLQTDIMRFMAILSLCLVAIFALVQSLPLTPVEPVAPIEPEAVEPVAAEPEAVAPEPAASKPKPIEPVEPEPVESEPVQPEPVLARPTNPQPDTSEQAVNLTRPKWVPKFTPAENRAPETTVIQTPTTESPPSDEPVGFVLRFESDAALMRAVAASHVGLYAIENQRAQRMTVSESRVSFWDASTPNTFHEMEATTVPRAVIEALSRTGTDTSIVSWGVTLPGKLKTRLDALMQAHQGGSLIIGAGGDIHWEAS